MTEVEKEEELDKGKSFEAEKKNLIGKCYFFIAKI